MQYRLDEPRSAKRSHVTKKSASNKILLPTTYVSRGNVVFPPVFASRGGKGVAVIVVQVIMSRWKEALWSRSSCLGRKGRDTLVQVILPGRGHTLLQVIMSRTWGGGLPCYRSSCLGSKGSGYPGLGHLVVGGLRSSNGEGLRYG